MEERELDLSGFGKRQIVDCNVHGNEPLGSINCFEFLN